MMAGRLSTPRYCIQQSRFTEKDDWRLWDLSLSLCGNIAVSGGNKKTRQTSIDVYSVRSSDSRDKPKIFYSKEFAKYSDENWIYQIRYVSFFDDDVLVSCLCDKLQVLQVSKDEVLRSRRVNGISTCLCVREKEIFIGFYQSNKITVFNVIDLNAIKSIILQGIQKSEYPYDVTAIPDRIFACVGDGKEESERRSLVFEETNGRILFELTKPTDTHCYAHSTTVSVRLGVVAVVWYDSYYYKEGDRNQVVFHSLLSENNSSFLIVEIESDVFRIRISERGDRMITGNRRTGNVKVYDMPDIFTYDSFKEKLASALHKDDCVRLMNFFKMSKEQKDTILGSDKPSENVLRALEGDGVIQPHRVDRLTEAFIDLKIDSSCCHIANIYQRTRISVYCKDTIEKVTEEIKILQMTSEKETEQVKDGLETANMKMNFPD